MVEILDGLADEDFGDRIIFPGLVDSHVHVNEPGRTEWEGFRTATAAAAAGGTTTIVDMPLNSIPPTVDAAALEAKRQSAEGSLAVDTAFWGGVVPGSLEHVPRLAEEGVAGFKMFMIDSGVEEFAPLETTELRSSLKALGAWGVPALVHAEEAKWIQPVESSRSYRSYLASRPVEAELNAVRTVAALAEDTAAKVHVLHVSSAEAVDAIGASSLSAETCPHYLTFDAGEIPDGATQFKCAPPIRDRLHREALWEGLRSGALAMVVSDHSPAPASLKALDSGDFAKAWGGISSLQLRLLAAWTGALSRGFGPLDLVAWLAESPAALAGLSDRKGSIAVGKDADFVIFDPDGDTVVDARRLEHRHPVTPYDGMKLRGKVVATYLRGVAVFDGTVRPGHGRMLRRNDRSSL